MTTYKERLKEQRGNFERQYKKRDDLGREWCTGKVLEIGCGEYPTIGGSTRMDVRKIDGVIQHDANKPFPFKDDTFDSICGFEVIEHLWNTTEFLRECNYVLKKDGRVIFSTPNIKHWRNRLNLLLGNDENFEVSEYGHIRYFSPESLKRYMEEAGFKVVEIRPMGRIPFLNLCGGFIIMGVKALLKKW